MFWYYYNTNKIKEQQLMASPSQYECEECGANWSEKKAKDCIYCRSKRIKIIWKPK